MTEHRHRTGEASATMRHCLELCGLYARVNRPVVFVGPVGAGKTTLARRLHDRSGKVGPFVALSTGELTESLYADRLFGHVPGAYTGAKRGRAGAFAQAAQGSLLLDDLAVMSRAAQVSILRALESRRYRPLGGSMDEVMDCRLMFASTATPSELGARGDLLPDLASRLGELTVAVPALTQRRVDIVPLAEQAIRGLLAEHGFTGSIEVTEKAAALLEAFDWPGNVRELRAVAERAAIHSGMDQSRVLIRAVHLPERVRDFDPSMATDPRLTRSLVESVMDEVGGNQSEAARRLGVHRNTIARYLRTG